MSRKAKIIVFSVLLLIAFINKQSNRESTYTPPTSSTKPNTNYNTPSQTNSSPSVANNNSIYSPTARPLNGFSPYDSYYGKGIYHNSTDNTIKVTAPVSNDIVIMFKNIYSWQE